MNTEDFIKNDAFAKFVGIELMEVKPGYAKAKLEISDKHLNGVGTVQGGVIFTLADLAFAAASNSVQSPTVGLNVSVNYFKPPQGEFITAEAHEVSRQRKISGYNVFIYDASGDLIAHFVGTGYTRSSKK